MEIEMDKKHFTTMVFLALADLAILFLVCWIVRIL
jgi:hypothetical protein